MTGIIVIPEGEHSLTVGPSSAERALNCLASVTLPGPSPHTEYAAEGTAAHTLSEWVRNERKHASHWRGKVLQVGEYTFKVGKAMIEGVMSFVEACESLPGVPMVEARVAYEELVPGGFGTLDDARMVDGTCVITDLKYGKGVEVRAADNMQLKLYALGLYFTYGWAIDFDKFVLRISQPRRDIFEEWPTTLGKLLEWGYDWVRPRARIALAGSTDFKAGAWCKFCKWKTECPTRARYKAEYERSPEAPQEAFVNLDS